MCKIKLRRGEAAACRREESTDIPTLTTERLILRPFRNGDLDAHAAMNADPRVMQYIGEVQDRAAAFRTMCAYMGHWYFRDYGPWAVEERATGAFVGRAGLTGFEPWTDVVVALRARGGRRSRRREPHPRRERGRGARRRAARPKYAYDADERVKGTPVRVYVFLRKPRRPRRHGEVRRTRNSPRPGYVLLAQVANYRASSMGRSASVALYAPVRL